MRKSSLCLTVALALLTVALSAGSVVLPMTGSKWGLYASGGVIKCGVSVCGSKQVPGTLANNAGIYFDFPNAEDKPVGSFIDASEFAGTGLNDVHWIESPPITTTATYCAVINGVASSFDGIAWRDTFSWGTDPSCTNGGTQSIQSTDGNWLANGVLIYFGNLPGHTLGDKWTVHYDYGTEATDWRGYLMTAPAVHTFTNAMTVTLTVDIAITGTPVFGFHPDGDYHCDTTPVTLRPHFQKGAWTKTPDDSSRWWAKGAASIPLGFSGTTTLDVPLQPEYWVQTWGKTGSATPALTSAFNATIASIGAIGIAMGGGCSYGHGVNISGDGAARLILKSYSVH